MCLMVTVFEDFVSGLGPGDGLARSLSVDEPADRVDEVGYGGKGPNNFNYGRLVRWRLISGALREFG